MNVLPQPMALLLGGVLLLSGCFSNEDKKPDTTNNTSAILATVNGQVITEDDVQFFINKTFSDNRAASNANIKQNILASLVASKAMAITMQAELSQETIDEIKLKSQHYQEELLVKEYLAQYAIPEPVSSAMINQYYQEHQEQFGKGEVKTVEILQRKTKPNELERDTLLSKMPEINSATDWQNYVNTKGENLGLSYLKTKYAPGLFDKNIAKVIAEMTVADKPTMTFVKGVPYIVRVSSIQTVPAKPLSSVNAEIRKKLAALQLKKAVKSSSENVLKQVNVVYTE